MFNSKKIAPVSLFLNLFKSEPSQTGLFYPDLCYLYLFENVCIDIHQFLIDYLGKNNRVLYVDIEIIVQIYFPTSKTCYIERLSILTFTHSLLCWEFQFLTKEIKFITSLSFHGYLDAVQIYSNGDPIYLSCQ